MEFLASRSASARWTPMDYAGWAVTVDKLRCIGLKTHLFTHMKQGEKEQANDEREKTERKERIIDVNLIVIYFSNLFMSIYY